MSRLLLSEIKKAAEQTAGVAVEQHIDYTSAARQVLHEGSVFTDVLYELAVRGLAVEASQYAATQRSASQSNNRPSRPQTERIASAGVRVRVAPSSLEEARQYLAQAQRVDAQGKQKALIDFNRVDVESTIQAEAALEAGHRQTKENYEGVLDLMTADQVSRVGDLSVEALITASGLLRRA